MALPENGPIKLVGGMGHKGCPVVDHAALWTWISAWTRAGVRSLSEECGRRVL